MSQQLFSIIYEGLVEEGMDPKAVETRLSVQGFLTPEDIEGLRTGKPVVLVSGVSQDRALQYRATLEVAGARSRLVPSRKEPTSASVSPQAATVELPIGLGSSPASADLGSAEQGEPSPAAPDLEPPGLATPDLGVPDLTTPELATPDLGVPDLATPELATPDLGIPDLATPDLGIPELDAPDLGPPVLAEPVLATPEAASPLLATPEVAPPELATPEAAPPELAPPAPDATAATRPAVTVLEDRPAPAAPETAQPRMTCPKCRFEQEESAECVACGIVVAKFLERQRAGSS